MSIKLQPSNLMTDEPKTMLVIQNSICKTVQEAVNGCPRCGCTGCILDADIDLFCEWLKNKIKLSME